MSLIDRLMNIPDVTEEQRQVNLNRNASRKATSVAGYIPSIPTVKKKDESILDKWESSSERFLKENPLGKAIDKFSYSLGEGFLGKDAYGKMQKDMGNEERYKNSTSGSKVLDKGIEFAGNVGGVFANPGGMMPKSLGTVADDAGIILSNKIAPNASKVAKSMTRGAIDGAVGEGLASIRDNEGIENVPSRVLNGAVGGAALFGGSELLGKAVKKIKSNEGPDIIRKAFDDKLGGIDSFTGKKEMPQKEVVDKLALPKIVPKVKTDTNGIARMKQKVKFSDDIAKEKLSVGEKIQKSWDKFYINTVDSNAPLKKVNERAYDLATTSKLSDGIVGNIMTNKLVDRNGNVIGKSLKELVSDIPKNKEDDFWEYMLQRHNIDRAREGKNVIPDFNSNMSARAVAKWEKVNPQFKAKADEITRWTDNLMNVWGVESGILNADMYRGLREMYPNYIPTNRIFDETFDIGRGTKKGFGDQSSPIKRATGSERDIQHPVESLLQQVNQVVKTAKYNEVANSLYGDILKNPQKWDGVAHILNDNITVPGNKNNVISVLVDGKKKNIRIDDKELLKSIKPSDSSSNVLDKVAKKYNNVFKSLITQYNPIFSVTNAMRDAQNYMVLSKENNPLKRLSNLGSAYGDLAKDMMGKEVPIVEKYRGVGGGGDMLNMQESSNYARNILDKKSESLPKKIIKAPLEAYKKGVGAVNNFTETAPRLAEFKSSLNKNNGDTVKALADSMDVTTNFSRSGDVTKALDTYVPFLNASVQGVDKIARAFKEKPIRTTVNGVAMITTPTLIFNALNKDNEGYKQLDNRTKDANYLIPTNDGKFIKIPKSRDMGVLFGALIERGVRFASGEEGAFKGFGNTVANGLAPVNPLESNIFSTGVNLARNKDFANRTIVPQSMQNLEKRYQYDERTSEIAKAIGNIANLSPKQVDYVIDSLTGIIGDVIIPATTKNPSQNAFDKVVKNKFVADPLYSNQATTDFYDNIDGLTTKVATDNFNGKASSRDKDKLKQLNKIKKEISLLNKQIKNTTDKDKIRSIKKQILIKTNKANKLK